MFKILTAAPLALLISFNVFAQAVTPTPKIAEQEVWVYEKIDGRRDTLEDRCSETVTGVSATQMTFRVKCEKGAEYDAVYTLEGNFVSGDGRKHSTYLPSLHFPLGVTSSWNEKYQLVKDGVTIFGNLDVKVVGFEKVTVPAGTFDAFKLEYKGYYSRSDYPGFSGFMKQTYWYAPALKRLIKTVYEDKFDHTETVLVSYRDEKGVVLAHQASPSDTTLGGAVDDIMALLRKIRPALGAFVGKIR